jgi:bifunctional UDP-N-acetylglucosamine pyrophosphorylase / glucosamine-1-phosphate N-acetyltransferase
MPVVNHTESPMSRPPLLVVVLAAGQGTRMKSALPKVLHKVGGRSMLGHVLALAQGIGADALSVVVGPGMDTVRAEALKHAPDAKVYVQEQQRGTADAVLAARDALKGHNGDVVVLYADTPLLTTDALERLRARLDDGAGICVLGFDSADPLGYGRLLLDGTGFLSAIREEKDASPAERAVRLCNSGVMAFRLPDLLGVLSRIGNANAKGEYYLTDAVEVARAAGTRAAVVTCAEEDVLGVNSRDQLAVAESIFQRRARLEVMREGATLIAPETVWLSYDTKIGRDVVIQPNVFFGPGVTVDDEAEILANCHFERAHIGKGARVGPFARLRPGADLGERAHVGNFVEVKNSKLGTGAKANHLSYIGDGDVGAAANIGAGTIFCNYDGFNKHRTEVGEGAFVGSNTSLVAPVKIGEGAYIGSGSVITKNVAPGALALERTGQEERPGWAAKFRTMMAKRKAKPG